MKKVIKIVDLLSYENNLYKSGINYIAGVDEVGRGPLVGPVVAAAVILPKGYKLEGLTDSKQLSEKKRNTFYDIIMKDAIAIGVGIKSNKIIDEVNIYEATKLAMKVWERGSGATLACGTGACAAVVAGVLNGFCELNSNVTVSLPGGELVVKRTKETVFLTGNAVLAYSGIVEI